MKRILIMLLMMCLALPVFAQKTTTGFYYPTDGQSKTGNYLSWLGPNSGYGGYHLAQDIKADVGSPVYTICDGIVVYSRTDVSNYGGDNPSRTGGGLVIEHFTDTGRRFYCLYAHLQTNGLPKVGTRVYAGQVIALVADYKIGQTSYSHLHFGVIPDKLPSNPWLGYTRDSNNQQGFVNPWVVGSGFLVNNRPAVFQNLEDNSMAREFWQPAVYLTVNIGRFWVSSGDEVNFFGGWSQVRLYAPGRLANLREAQPIDGTMYRKHSAPEVFLQLYGKRWWLLSEGAVQRWGGRAAVHLVPDRSFDTRDYAGTIR